MLEKLQQIISDFYTEHKTAFLGFLTAIILALVGGGYVAGQQNPAPEAVEMAIAARASATAAPGRPATATKKPVASSTPKPATATVKPPALTATNTSVPGSTSTPGGVATPTMPPMAGMCPDPVNVWQMPQNLPCEHWTRGDNPFRPDIVALFDKYGKPGEYVRWMNDYGVMYQVWVSSSNEIKSHGRGFKWVFTENLNCEQVGGGAKDFSKVACVVYSMDRLHDDGSAKHSIPARHSLTTHRIVCSKNTAGKVVISVATCGVFRGGMSQADSDQLQTPYKTTFCNLPGDNPVWTAAHPPNVGNGGVYHSMQTSLPSGDPVTTGWWFQKPEAIEAPDYPYGPNQMFQTTFISQAWQLFQPYVCEWEAKPSLATAAGYDMSTMTVLDAIKAETDKWPLIPAEQGGGNNLIQILNLGVQAFSKTGSGWNDPDGHIYPMGEPDGGCVTASYFCIPYSVEGNYPLNQEARLARRFPGNDILACDNAPCIVFPTNGVILLPPILDMP